ncbi:MAG: hypothetical protein IKU84_00605 [Clostridia bacterium]|nr:hypothetical protein [Clostridia bacterium]
MSRKSEILRYLGYKKAVPRKDIDGAIDRIEKEIESVAEPRTVKMKISIENMPFCGKTVEKAMHGCKKAIIFAATLGAGVDRLIMQKECSNISEAVIAQAIAAALIEEVCDKLQGEYESYPRVSPGYGDFPLAAQRDILKILSADTKIGLSTTEALMLVPTKSVTAIFAIKE